MYVCMYVCMYVYIYIHIYIYVTPPPQDPSFLAFANLKEVAVVGNLLQKQSKYTLLLSKKSKHLPRSENTPFFEGSNMLRIAAFLSMPLEKHLAFIGCSFPSRQCFKKQYPYKKVYRAFL